MHREIGARFPQGENRVARLLYGDLTVPRGNMAKDDKKEEKKDAKAEKPEATPEEAAAKAKKKKLLIAAIGGVVLLGGGGAALAMFLAGGGDKGGGDHAAAPAGNGSGEALASGSGSGSADAPASGSGSGSGSGTGSGSGSASAQGSGSDAKAAKLEGVDFGCTQPLAPFHLNLGNPLENRYIRLEVSLEYGCADEIKAEIEKRLPQLRDAIISVTSRKTREFLLGPDGKEQLRKEIGNRVNHYMTAKIDDVFITDILIE